MNTADAVDRDPCCVDVVREGSRTAAYASYTQPVEFFPTFVYPLDLSFTVEAGGGRSGYLGTIVRDVKAGAADLVLRVSVGVDLAGMLVDAKGDPVATTSLVADDGARVAAMRPYAQVGPDGAFLLRGLRAGPVRLSLWIGQASVDAGAFAAPATGLRVVVPSR